MSALLKFFGIVLSTSASVVINEVASQGSSSDCSGEDWVELLNGGSSAVFLGGFVLHDDNGPSDSKAFTFAANATMAAGAYLGLCCKSSGSLQFKIGGDDTVTLLDAGGAVVSTSGALLGSGTKDTTWARKADGRYEYTTTPTFGAENVFAAPASKDSAQLLAELVAQNDEGEQFFGMNRNGLHVDHDPVVEIKVMMLQADFEYMMKNSSYEVYSPVKSFEVKNSTGTHTLPHPGRMRPRGQSTLYFPVCSGMTAIPFLLDFNSVNREQTLFGVSKGYLRNGLGDPSFLKEWSAHRMLARFGLPYLRTRSVRLFINDVFIGLYLFMEAPDQEYVFARSFPGYNRSDFGLYKVKTTSNMCPNYDPLMINHAPVATNESKFQFRRGEHRDQIPVHVSNPMQCWPLFLENMAYELLEVVGAWKMHGRDCGKMLVAEGRVDRDLGEKTLDPVMVDFINKYMVHGESRGGQYGCKKDFDCSTTGLAVAVDSDQWLKNLAVYAVTITLDSPLGNGNNWFLAHTGAGKGWKIVQYDHNNLMDPSEFFCPGCQNDPIHWAITRPRCHASDTQLVAPFLSDPTLFARYIEHVRNFTENVFSNSSLYSEILAHATAIQNDVASDPHAKGFDYSKEISATPWKAQDKKGPVLSFITQRSASIKDQLRALDDGSFPRMPDKVGASETCQDWRMSQSEALVLADGCPKAMGGACAPAAQCFKHGAGCANKSGEFAFTQCANAKPCAPCFPNSRCGSLVKDESALLVFADGCPKAMGGACATSAQCFKHDAGCATKSGKFAVTQCENAKPCAPCFPNSRCAKDGSKSTTASPASSTTTAIATSTTTASASITSKRSADTAKPTTMVAHVIVWALLALAMRERDM